MKVLIVCSGNSGNISPFIKEQANSLQNLGIVVDYFLITGKGIIGYLKNYFGLCKKIKKTNVDLIHAHYGLSGLLSTLQLKRPVIITFHGSDINVHKIRKYSYWAARLSSYNIFVHKNLLTKINYSKNNFSIIPCGVNLKTFTPLNKNLCHKELNFQMNIYHILFSSSFSNLIKNYKLAENAKLLLSDNVKLLELKNLSPTQVNTYMNAVDCLLVTSLSETGPVVVKEAMAINCPIVSTDVGDVREVIGNTKGCYLTSFDPEDAADKMKKALAFGKRTNGRQHILELGLDSKTIASKIINVYNKVLEN